MVCRLPEPSTAYFTNFSKRATPSWLPRRFNHSILHARLRWEVARNDTATTVINHTNEGKRESTSWKATDWCRINPLPGDLEKWYWLEIIAGSAGLRYNFTATCAPSYPEHFYINPKTILNSHGSLEDLFQKTGYLGSRQISRTLLISFLKGLRFEKCGNAKIKCDLTNGGVEEYNATIFSRSVSRSR